jgi:hypothetical protein
MGFGTVEWHLAEPFLEKLPLTGVNARAAHTRSRYQNVRQADVAARSAGGEPLAPLEHFKLKLDPIAFLFVSLV